MSRGLGQRQLTVLRILATYEASGEPPTLPGLRVEEISHRAGRSLEVSASLWSSTRRALAKMSSMGLVGGRYYPHLQGQPRIWKITETGLAMLERRGFAPDVTAVLVYRADIYRRQQRYQDAIACLDHAIEITCDNFRAIKERAETCRVMGYYTEAIVDFTRALELNSDDAWTLVRRGLAYRAVAHYAEAITDFSHALELDPENSSVAVAGRGEAHRLLGNYDKSIGDLSRAIEIKPDYLWAIERRSLAYRAVGRYTEAITDLTRAIELKPNYCWAIVERGEVYGLLGAYQQALDDLARALKLDPNQDDVRTEYSRFRALLMRHHDLVLL